MSGERAFGRLAFVQSRILGSQASASAVKGATSLLVVDASDLLSDDGGLIDVGQAGQPFPFDSCVLNADGTTGTVTVSAGLPFDVATGARVDLWNADEAEIEYIAGVIFDGDVGASPVGMSPDVVPWFRDAYSDAGMPSVELEEDDEGWWVRRPRSKSPRHRLSFADPDDPITPGAITTSWDSNASDFASRAHPEMLGSGDVTGTLGVKGAIKTGGSGAGGTTLDAAGFRTYRSSGEPRSGFLNDDDQPDILRGVVDGTKGNFTEGVYLDGVNVLGQGASFQLHSSIDPPHLEPTVFTDWPCVDVAFPDPLIQGIQPSDRFGFAVKSGTEAYCLMHTVTAGGGIGTEVQFSFSIAKFNPDVSSGAYVGSYTFAGAPTGTPASLSYSSLSDRLVTLELVASTYVVRTWHTPSGSSVAFDAQWTPTGISSSLPTPVIAVKNILGTEYVVISQSQLDGTIKIRNYVAQALVETMTTPVAMNMGSLQGMAHLGGTIALAGNVTWLNSDGAPALPVFDVSGFFAPKGTLLGALQVGNGDPLAAGIATWDSDTEKARTWYLSRASNSVIQHSNVFEAGAYWAQAAWGDSATGHLTLPSSAVLVQKIPGSRVTIGLGEMPTGVDSAMLYFGAGGSYPGVAGMWSQNTLTAGSAYVRVFTVQNASPYVNPLTVATLTGGTPAKIVNAAGVTLLDANSTPGGGGGGGGALLGAIYGGNAYESGWGLIAGGTASSTGTADTIFGGKAA